MKPVGLLDSAFLHAESAATPMHVGALFILDPMAPRARRSFFGRFRTLVARRLGASEVFTRRLAPLPLHVANPLWATTHEVDLDHHVRRSVLPRPGNLHQLEHRVARLHEALLDRNRPLWELHLIEGLEGDRVALYAKVHHAGLDGQSGQLFVQAFTDSAPRPPGAARRMALPAADDDSPARRILSGAGQQLRAGRELARQFADVAGAAAHLLRGRSPATPATPRTVLNEVVSGRRSFATAELPLQALQDAARPLRGTVNDVLLAGVAGAVRRWLLQRGLLPQQPLFAGVPVSTRSRGDTELAIRVTMIPVNLHTAVADPLERLAAIHGSADAAKADAGAFRSLVPGDAPSLGLPWLLGGLGRLAGHPDVLARVPLPFNLVVSNVPGPPVPLYVAGARVATYLPVSVVYHGVGLNVSAYSYDGRVFVGIVACTDLMPDTDAFARDILDELAALQPQAAVSRRPATSSRSSGKRAAATRRGTATSTRAPARRSGPAGRPR